LSCFRHNHHYIFPIFSHRQKSNKGSQDGNLACKSPNHPYFYNPFLWINISWFIYPYGLNKLCIIQNIAHNYWQKEGKPIFTWKICSVCSELLPLWFQTAINPDQKKTVFLCYIFLHGNAPKNWKLMAVFIFFLTYFNESIFTLEY